MENEKKVKVEMTAEQAEAFAAFQAKQKKEAEAAQRKADRETYAKMVDEEVAAAIPELRRLSDDIKAVKSKVYQNFAQVLDIKSNVLGITKDTQRTHTFTHSDGNMRLTLGYNCIDGYRDTVEDGIAIVKEYIEGLADNKKTKALVKMVLRLLARNAQGTLKASRIVQLRKIAEESEDERFMEGVQIIEEAYQPAISKQFIRAEVKNDNGAWIAIPLGMTEA